MIVAFASVAFSDAASAQVPGADRLRRAVDREVDIRLEDLAEGTVQCVFDQLDCIRAAQEAGDPVVLTDEEGTILTDEDGAPITDPDQLPDAGPTSDFEFEPGERPLFVSDFSVDNLGDFPRGLEFIQGNMQVVEWQGRRFLQADAPQSRFAVALPETLPERFTIEFDMYDASGSTGSDGIGVTTAEPSHWDIYYGHYYEAHYFNAGSRYGSGLWTKESRRISSAVDARPSEGLTPVRIMVDDAHAKMFIDRTRVANVPTANLPRTEKLYFFLEPMAPNNSVLIGGIRIAAGGRDLYDALEADGRVAVRSILFDTGEATIRSESSEVLEQIGTMLNEHPALSLMIEGHTDDEGEFDMNMRLSGDRAASVKAYLIENSGVAADRLRTLGLGPTQPVDTNDTDAGRQQNRRVELVKIG
jgi:outer membrane protein OmpA-like peptidoglycan-associated protein